MLLVAVGVALLGAVSAALAGEYHTGNALKCTQCHVMHASNQGTYYGTGGPTNPTGFPDLLMNASPNAQCLSCHGSSVLEITSATGTAAAPNMIYTGGETYTSLYGSSAGIFQSDCLTASTTCGHNLFATAPLTAIQGTWQSSATGMQCVDCHDPHGNANYRNLRTNPGTATGPINIYSSYGTGGSWTLAVPAVTDPGTYQVFERAKTKYNTDDVAFNAVNNMSTWCEGCHTNIESTAPTNKHPQNVAVSGLDDGGANWVAGVDGSPGFMSTNAPQAPSAFTSGTTGTADGIPRLRFAQSGTTFAACGGPATSPIGAGTTAGVATTNQVFCLTCHKAHGGQYSQNLVWPNGYYTTPGGHTPVAQAFAGCNQCHAKGI